MTIETVFKLRDNTNTVNFSDDNGVIDFTGATRGVLKFEGSLIVADTDVDPTLIDFTLGSGDVAFNLNSLLVAEGEFPASFIVYDVLHPLGQIIVHAEDKKLVFRFLDPI